MDLGNIDLTSVSEFGTSILPPGEYVVAIANCEGKSWPSGDQYVSVTYKVQEGPSTGRTCFDSLSLWDSEPKFRDMAYSKLKSIRKAVGLNPNVSGTTEELLGKVLTVKVGVRSKDGKDYQNVNGYKPASSSSASVPPQAAPQPAPSSAMPW